MKRKKLLFIYYRLFKPGGVTKTLTNLANEMVNFHDVTILVLMENKDTFFPLDTRVKVISVDTFKHWAFAKGCVAIEKYFSKIPKKNSIKSYLYDFGSYRVLTKWLNKNHEDYDYLIPCLYKLNAFLAVNNTVNKKTVTWEKNSFDGVNKFWRFFNRFYPKLFGVSTLNRQGKEYYSKLNPNTHLIHNIVGGPIESVNEIDFTRKQNRVLYVGRLSQEKNVDHLIKCFSKSRIPDDWILQIVGYGEKEPELRRQISALGMENKVHILGQKNLEEIKAIMLESKITCLTSSTEGLPNVLIEAMMCGNALLSYNCKYGPDEIINGKNGILVPLFDKERFTLELESLINDEEKLNQMMQESFLESKNWKKEGIVEKWNRIFF